MPRSNHDGNGAATADDNGTSGGNGRAGMNGNANGNGHRHNGGAGGQEARKTEILVPGLHLTPHAQSKVDVSEGTFSDSVVSALPDDLLYRSGRTVGVLAGCNGSREFHPGDTRHLRILASEHVDLVEWQRTRKGNLLKSRVRFGVDLANLVLGRAELSDSPKIRRLDRIIHYPAYGRNFELLRPGWQDGTYYDPPPELEGIEPETDREVIAQVLDDLVTDFPFMAEGDDGGDANRQNFYGLLLTPIVRTAITGNVPLHLVNAPLERTGKGKLVGQVVGGVFLGAEVPALQHVANGEEFDKRVTGLLVGGETLVHLDNVNDALALGQLASVLTAAVYHGRLLGTNVMVKLANTLIWMVSGNNVEGSAEIVKRVVPIHLQPKDAHPEDRPVTDFVHPDLPAYVRAVRRDVLACLLGMVEVWKAGGRPMSSRPMGGFEEWAKVVGGVLKVNGFDQWMTNAKAWQKTADVAGGDMETLVETWADRLGICPVKPRHLLRIAAEAETFDDLRRGTKDGGLNRLCRLLRKSQNKPVGKYVIKLQASGNNTHYYLQGAKDKGFTDADKVLGSETPAPEYALPWE